MLDLLLFGQKTSPDFFWDARGGILAPGMSFTRASAGWFFNSAGVLTQASSNVARFDYDPNTLTPLGYLAEMQSTNLCPQSAALTTTNWAAGSGVTSATDGTLGPDGVTQMYKITSAAGAGYHQLAMAVGSSLAAGSSLSVSFIVKQGNQRYVTIGDYADSVWHVATFDFQTGAWAGAGTNATTEVPRQLANGLWRIGVKYTNTNAAYNAGPTVSFGPNAAGGGAQNYTAAGTETGYATAAQVESGGVGVTSHIPTAGSSATRAQDILSLPLTSLSGWKANSGGVLVAAYRLHTQEPTAPGNNQPVAAIDDGTATTNGVAIIGKYGADTTFGGFFASGGTLKSVLAGAAASPFVRRKQAICWDVNRQVVAYDGTLLQSATQALSLPVAPTNLHIGLYSSSGPATNGTIESIAYYAGARSDAFVQQVSR